MAEAQDRHIGNDELVFVASAAPTAPADPTDAAYKRLGLQASFSYSSQAQATEIRDKLGSGTFYGSNTRTATLGANTSFEGDDAQTTLTNAAEASPKPDVWVLITSGVSGERARHFKCKVGGLTDASPVDAAATLEYTLGIDGAPTLTTVA